MIRYITASGEATLPVTGLRKMIIMVNAALTGTITVTHAAGTTIAVITNPTVGTMYEYWDLVGAITVNPSATCNITVSGDGGRGPK